MTDVSKKLQSKYAEISRYSNFGPCLRKVHIHGFRGINSLNLEINFPITAISGLNGAGKSTIGQLAICAYRKPLESDPDLKAKVRKVRLSEKRWYDDIQKPHNHFLGIECSHYQTVSVSI